MPIRHFDYFLQERKLIHTESVESLKKVRLGVDGNFWLRRVLNGSPKEPIQVALGGYAAPSQLEAEIRKSVKWLTDREIKPFFVFNGITPLRKEKPFTIEDTRPMKRAIAWEQYERGLVPQALQGWGTSGSIASNEMVHIAVDVLRDMNIPFARAPYLAGAQLGYLLNHPKQYIHAIYGNSELLIWDQIRKVVTCLDGEDGKFTWVDKGAILNDLGINEDQFLDICILAGFDYCSTFPPLTADPLTAFTFVWTIDLIRQYKSGYDVAQAYVEHPSVAKTDYIDLFCRTRALIKYCVILTEKGTAEPLNQGLSPADIHKILGMRLPDDVYCMLWNMVIGQSVLNALTSSVQVEPHPLCNGEGVHYHEFCKSLIPLRRSAFSTIGKHLHPAFSGNPVVLHFYFEPTRENNVDISGTASDPEIFVNPETLSLGVDNDASVLSRCLDAFNGSNRPRFLGPDQTVPKLESKAAIMGTAIYRFLITTGLLTLDSKNSLLDITPAGKMIMDQVDTIREPLIVLFGLLQNSGFPHSVDAETTLAQIASLLPYPVKRPWGGPVIRDLLIFNCYARQMTKIYRNVVEMHLASLLLSDAVQKEGADIPDLGFGLLFSCDVTAATGVLLHQALLGTPVRGAEKYVARAKEFCKVALPFAMKVATSKQTIAALKAAEARLQRAES